MAEAAEIEITPKMVEAGVLAYEAATPPEVSLVGASGVVAAVFMAMNAASKSA